MEHPWDGIDSPNVFKECRREAGDDAVIIILKLGLLYWAWSIRNGDASEKNHRENGEVKKKKRRADGERFCLVVILLYNKLELTLIVFLFLAFLLSFFFAFFLSRFLSFFSFFFSGYVSLLLSFKFFSPLLSSQRRRKGNSIEKIQLKFFFFFSHQSLKHSSVSFIFECVVWPCVVLHLCMCKSFTFMCVFVCTYAYACM